MYVLHTFKEVSRVRWFFLSAHNICFGDEIRKIFSNHLLLSEGLMPLFHHSVLIRLDCFSVMIHSIS